jgi:hypothetical protein
MSSVLLGEVSVRWGAGSLAWRLDAAAVDVGAVEEVDASLERLVHDREARRLVGDPPEIHRPESETADLQA